MSTNNPLFALVPSRVLLKAKELAVELNKEERLQDLAGRRILSLTAIILLSLWVNGVNAMEFVSIAVTLVGTEPSWPMLLVALYALLIWLGGTAVMFSAYVAWLEVVVFRSVNPLANPREENLQFYRRSTWGPVIPLVAIPALFNAWFSVSFFLVSVSLVLAAVMVAFVYADV